MKRAMKRLVAVVLAIGCVLTTGAFASYDEVTTLAVDDGKLAVAPAQTALDAYFNARNNALNEPVMLMSADDEALPASPEITADVAARAEALTDFWANEDVTIVSTTVTSKIISAAQQSRSTDINAVVYEWTWLDYQDGDSEEIDRMGFATVHDMTLAPGDNGEYAVVRDSYDEMDITGHTSSDYDAAAFEFATAGISTTSLYNEITGGELAMPANDWPEIAPRAISGNVTNILDSIDYADSWVIHDIAADYDAHDSYYNTSVFGTFPGNDCCNYVSQCLYAGGLDFTSNSTSSGWYHARGGSTSCSGAWSSVQEFVAYWGKQGYSYTSTSNGVIPGNPVFYYGTGGSSNHIAFCVGYNSAGNPIINGHTRDVYHQKMDSVYKNTVNFNTKSPFVSTPGGAATISMPGTLSGLYLQAGKAEWFKFTPSTSGYHTVYSTGNADTYGVLYQQDRNGSNGTMYLYELTSNDDSMFSDEGNNFRMGTNLTAGKTYYFMVRGSSPSDSGSFGLVLQKG